MRYIQRDRMLYKLVEALEALCDLLITMKLQHVWFRHAVLGLCEVLLGHALATLES